MTWDNLANVTRAELNGRGYGWKTAPRRRLSLLLRGFKEDHCYPKKIWRKIN